MALLILVLFGFGSGSLAYAVFARGRRKRHFLRGLAALGGVVAVSFAFGDTSAERAARRVAADQGRAARLAAEDRARAEQDAACRADLSCVVAKVEIAAALACAREVERLGKFASRWVDGSLEPKFPRAVWGDREAGTVVFAGDRIEFQNGFGAWAPHFYACEYDPETKRVLSVTATPGRL